VEEKKASRMSFPFPLGFFLCVLPFTFYPMTLFALRTTARNYGEAMESIVMHTLLHQASHNKESSTFAFPLFFLLSLHFWSMLLRSLFQPSLTRGVLRGIPTGIFRVLSVEAGPRCDPVSAEAIEKKIVTSLEPCTVNVIDMSGGCGKIFKVVVESSLFASKTRIQQHRMVTDSLCEELKVCLFQHFFTSFFCVFPLCILFS
jgi:stress-induced morphogen